MRLRKRGGRIATLQYIVSHDDLRCSNFGKVHIIILTIDINTEIIKNGEIEQCFLDHACDRYLYIYVYLYLTTFLATTVYNNYLWLKKRPRVYEFIGVILLK